MADWSKNILKIIVENSESIAECLRQLGLKPLGSNYRTFKKKVKEFNLDTSHFLGLAHGRGKPRPDLAKEPLETYLIENSSYDPHCLKRRLIKEKYLEYKCDDCGIATWRGKEIVLHLDHINGINNDHRIENLRLLCPNCHSQTNTYCGKNNRATDYVENSDGLRVIKVKIENKCVDCNATIFPKSTRCLSCAGKNSQTTKITWPETSALTKMVEEFGYEAAGRQLGVSGNAVKKRIKNYPEK